MKKDEIKVGIIGCGGIANAHVGGYQENGLKITAITDLNSEAMDKLEEKIPGVKKFSDFKALIDSGEVNTVSICTPPVAHKDAAVYALQKGINVLLEKPQANTLEAAKEIYEASKKSKAVLMMAYRHRFLPANIKLKEMIDNGKIGKVVFFRNVFCGPMFGMKDRWFTDKAIAGGGSILDTSSHSLDLFRFMIGEVAESTAVMNTNFEGRDVEDTGILSVKAENGALGVMTSSFAAGDGMAFLDITGQEGRLIYDYCNGEEIKYKKLGNDDWEIIKVKQSGGFIEQIAHFADVLEGKNKLKCTAKDGLRGMEIITGCY
jgi:predicted dehydrogenase